MAFTVSKLDTVSLKFSLPRCSCLLLCSFGDIDCSKTKLRIPIVEALSNIVSVNLTHIFLYSTRRFSDPPHTESFYCKFVASVYKRFLKLFGSTKRFWT